MIVTLPWPPRSLSPNARGSWQRKAGAVKDYRRSVAEAVWNAGIRPTDGAQLLEIEFRPPSARWDDDNARASFKAGRDAIAEVLGVDDRIFNTIPKPFGEPIAGGAVLARIEIPG